MDPKKPILPVNSNSFKRDANNLFSLSTDELLRLVESFQSVKNRRTSFSIDHVSNVVKAEPDKIKSIRSTFLYLIEIMKEYSNTETVADELVSIGCNKQKVEFFTKQIQS